MNINLMYHAPFTMNMKTSILLLYSHRSLSLYIFFNSIEGDARGCTKISIMIDKLPS